MDRGNTMTRYARQMILPQVGAAGQSRLASAHVLVVGCGGLGSAVIPALAGAGVGTLSLMDHDQVEESNLHRQLLYTLADVGVNKAACAARAIRQRNPEVSVEVPEGGLTPYNVEDALHGVDLVIDAADSFAVTYTLSDACLAQGLPLISASVLGLSGYVGGFCGGAPSYRAVFPDLPAQAGSCAETGVMGPVVAMLGAAQAQMALSSLLGLSPNPLGQMLQMDLQSFRLSGFRFDGAPEPDQFWPFVDVAQFAKDDVIVELRPKEEALLPAHPSAHRGLPIDLPKDNRIVLVCRSGLRSWRAARGLAERGYHDIALCAAGTR